MISAKETELGRLALRLALEKGAQKARVTLVSSSEDLVATLNGEVDKITRCQDRSLSIALFVDGRYGSFSTNKLEEKALEDFIGHAIDIVRMLVPDSCRDLPAPERCCKDAVSGNELELVDPAYASVTPELRREIAVGASAFRLPEPEGCKIVSEEGEYSDSIYDTLVLDTQGLECRHTETSFDYGVEITIEADDELYSGYWWDSSSRLDRLDAAGCGKIALERAQAKIGAEPAPSGKYTMVLDAEVAYKAVSALIRALNANSIQQKNSFLEGSLGKKVFPEGMTLIDDPHIKEQCCSKLFDSEGVATKTAPIIEKGVVSQYFVNSYMAAKTGMAPTSEDVTRAHLMPWPKAGTGRKEILEMCGEGILVTDFNGGNYNTSTGDFSYGVEGFLFKDGKIGKPVSEMLVTGNYITMWSRLVAAGEDTRACMSKLIPTLAFSEMDFNG